MSPEIALGEYYNELSDIYSLGLLSYEILSLNRPYENNIAVVDDCATNTTPEVDNDKNGNESSKSKSYRSRRHIRRNKNNNDNNKNDKKQQQDDNENNNSNNKNKNMKNDDYKYLNVRPLLPIMTPHEEEESSTSSLASLYWTKSLRSIILQSWDRNIQNRPTAIEIQKQFQIEYDKFT